MRNLFLMLLIANILFLAWRGWVYEPDADVELVNPVDLGEPVPLQANTPEDENQTDLVALDTEPEAPAKTLPATVGRACITVGPFTDVADANAELKLLTRDGLQVAERAAQGNVFIGYWVYVNNIPTRAKARALLRKLKEDGIEDSYLIAGDTGEDAISLGIFTSQEGAERTELKAKSVGVDANIDDRYRQSTVFWLDIKLKPGQPGSQLVDTYGADKVLLGDAATCPGNG